MISFSPLKNANNFFFFMFPGTFRMALFALRDIDPGEELTYDYNFSLFNPAVGQVIKTFSIIYFQYLFFIYIVTQRGTAQCVMVRMVQFGKKNLEFGLLIQRSLVHIRFEGPHVNEIVYLKIIIAECIN